MSVNKVKENANLKIDVARQRELKGAVNGTLVLATEELISVGMLLKEGTNLGEWLIADESSCTAVINYVPALEDVMPENEVILPVGSHEIGVALEGACFVQPTSDDATTYARLRQFSIQAMFDAEEIYS